MDWSGVSVPKRPTSNYILQMPHLDSGNLSELWFDNCMSNMAGTTDRRVSEQTLYGWRPCGEPSPRTRWTLARHSPIRFRGA